MKMQGLYMVSRNVKHFYWVTFSSFLKDREIDSVSQLISSCWVNLYQLASSKEFHAYLWILSSIVCGFYLFCVTAGPKLKGFQSTQWKSYSLDVFLCMASQFCVCDLIALFYEQNRYFVNPGCGLQSTESQERMNNYKTLLGWILIAAV